MAAPVLSVLVVGSRPGGPPPELFGALAGPVAAGQVELLLVTARREPPTPAGATRVVRCPAGSTVPAMRLCGVRAAAGSLVALTEDFCVPAPGWAQALLDAHRRKLAPVLGGPVARRSGGAADWALTLIEYGRFFGGEPGPVPELPSINVAYDRQALLSALPPDGAGLFEVEVHARLRAAGHTFYRLPEAVMFDYNAAPLRASAVGQYHHGRLFGGGRAAGKGLAARLRYAALSPAVPAVLLSRIARGVRGAGQTPAVLRALPALSLLLGAWALGEGVGSVLGPGESAARWT